MPTLQAIVRTSVHHIGLAYATTSRRCQPTPMALYKLT